MDQNWVQFNSHSGAPHNAVLVGQDVDGSPIYVGRAHHDGDLIPAKAIPCKHVAYVPFGGHEHSTNNYHLLVGHGFEWVSSSNGHIPESAVVGGRQQDGQVLYVGRARVGGSVVTGKVHPSHGCIYVPFGGSEHKFHEYEILVAPRRSTWVHSTKYSMLPPGAVHAGYDQDRTEIFVGRAWHNGDHLPAKVIPSKQCAYVAWGGEEILKDEYEVLCYGNVMWVKSHPSSVPPYAVPGGVTSNGETLYIGRAHYDGSLTVGKVHVAHGCLYIPFGGSEHKIQSEIEYLVEY